MGYPITQNQTALPLVFMLFATGTTTGITGRTPTVTISKNGGAYAAPAGAVSEIGGGLYAVAPNATDANTQGPLMLKATATGADECNEQFLVVAYNGQDAAALGLTTVGSIKTDTTAIKAKTDNLPASPAAVGSAMTLADGAITAAKLADGAITAAKIADDALTAAKLAADAVAEIQSGLSTLDQAAIRSAIGLAAANLGDLIASLETNTQDLPTLVENDGLPTARFTEQALEQAPAGGGGGTGAVQLVFGPLTLYTEAAGTSQILRPTIGDTITVRGHLRDAGGDPISVVGATLTAKLFNLAGEELLDLTVDAITEDEGVLDIELPLTDDALVAGRRYRLVVTRTLGLSVTNFPLSVVLEA